MRTLQTEQNYDPKVRTITLDCGVFFQETSYWHQWNRKIAKAVFYQKTRNGRRPILQVIEIYKPVSGTIEIIPEQLSSRQNRNFEGFVKKYIMGLALISYDYPNTELVVR